MKVLLAASEAVPYAKAGGLADVTGSLVKELRSLKVDARLILPLYRNIKSRFDLQYTGSDIKVPLGEKVHEARLLSHGDTAFFIECNEFFGREEIYGTSKGEYYDNAQRFIFFSRAVLESCLALGFMPDVLHCSDWQTGLVPFYMRTIYEKQFKAVPSLFTIHNLGYQGVYPPSAMTMTGLPQELFNPEALEFYGGINLMKAGIVSADWISTVSENYAREILSERYGFGLDGVLRNRSSDLTGITNGVDYSIWNPESDETLPAKYGPDDLSGKSRCKRALVGKLSLKKPSAPIVGFVGRMVSQKGFDIFLDAADAIIEAGVNVVILGKGEDSLQRRMKGLAVRYPGRVGLNICYDETLARLVYAGSDIILVPSRYEPCGLVQMIAMRYGAVPVARATGGIVDTVKDYDHLKAAGTGFLFSGYSSSALEEAVKRALCLMSSRERWKATACRCMGTDFSWKKSARKYLALYVSLLRKDKDENKA